MEDDALAGAARTAYGRALLGDFALARQVLAATETSRWIGAPAWSAVLRTVMAAAHPSLATPASLGELSMFVDAPTFVREVAALACAEHHKSALLQLDADGRDAVVALHASLAPDGTTEAGLWLRLARAWSRWLGGDVDGLAEEVAAIGHDASSLQVAAALLESTTLRALCALTARDLEEATTLARRASRMARTEAILQQEYLANLVLSRVRRMTGHPHLATRILGALLAVASPRFADFLRWELLVAGALELGRPPAEPPTTRAGAAVTLLAALLHGAEQGDRVRFEEAGERLSETLAPFAMLAAEASTIRSAIDLRIAPSPDASDWCAGATRDPPPALQGLCTRIVASDGDGSADSAIAYVVSAPEGQRRRILRLGRALVDLPRLVTLKQGRRKQGRIETLVSTLALAGLAGMDDASCFREVYEFDYEVETHKGVFDVLVHRARDYIEEAGTIERGGGTIRLLLHRPVSVPDPRCAQPLQDRLLRTLARSGASTAKELAQAAGVSLRTAQAALQELATDGMCLVQRQGRRVSYAVEDTTFREPTVHRGAALPAS